MFRAHDPIEGRLVALKMFRLDLPPEQTADFAAALEDVVSQQPQHPTIAAALAAGVEGKQAYLAQEYVVGDSLDAVIRQSGRAADRRHARHAGSSGGGAGSRGGRGDSSRRAFTCAMC